MITENKNEIMFLVKVVNGTRSLKEFEEVMKRLRSPYTVNFYLSGGRFGYVNSIVVIKHDPLTISFHRSGTIEVEGKNIKVRSHLVKVADLILEAHKRHINNLSPIKKYLSMYYKGKKTIDDMLNLAVLNYFKEE